MIAGFMHGFTGHDDKSEMEQCYKDSPEFLADMCDVYANLVTKDNQKVLSAIQKFMGDLPQFHTFMEPCKKIGTIDADFTVVRTWF